MNKELNNYTIEDFLNLKSIIYKYCVNLTPLKLNNFRCRRKDRADDLYQEVFIYVSTTYFNKPKELMNYSRFVQIMKNCTYYTSVKLYKKPSNRIYKTVNRIDDSPKDFFLFECAQVEQPKEYLDFENSIDYQYYINKLNSYEQKFLKLYLDGYTLKEIKIINDELKNNIHCTLNNNVYHTFNNIKKKLSISDVKQSNIKSKVLKPVIDDLVFLKNKVKNFDLIFNKNNFIKLYSLYLQGFNHKEIGEILKKSTSQVTTEIYRINKKIKKYEV